MNTVKLQISSLVALLITVHSIAQNKYTLLVQGVDKEGSEIVTGAGLQTQFDSRQACADYVRKLPGLLQAKGYVTASIDSLRFDSSSARIDLFIGSIYRWAKLDLSHVDRKILESTGWNEKLVTGTVDFIRLENMQELVLQHLENSGYPFARVYLDSVSIVRESNTGASPIEIVSAVLQVQKGPLYKIDSMRVFGNLKLSNRFLQRYLDMMNGSLYNREKLKDIGKKMGELPYVEEEKPWDMSLLGTDSVLNLYLKPKKSSQVNLLIGFLPNNDQLSSKKLLITGEGNLLLRNALGSGETIGLNFQALQVESQRLNILYRHPYLFNTPAGLDFYFDIFRKDSSFVNVNGQLGADYILNGNEKAKLFITSGQTIVNEGGINTAYIILNKKLPDVADVSSFTVGLDYELNKTDFRRNPRKGTTLGITTSIGTKNIKKNNQVLTLKDPANPGFVFDRLYDTVKLKTYLLKVQGSGAHYFPLGNQRSTLKTALYAGLLQGGTLFRNEMFQLGGFKLLRGFDEESQYLSAYATGTVEFRYLVGPQSFFYLFADGGWGQDNRQHAKLNYQYVGTGLGLNFETKAGIFNMAWAIGTRNDIPFSLRQSKIHIGFVNYF